MSNEILNIDPSVKKADSNQGDFLPPNVKGLDPLFLAYFFLIEASNLTANNAVIHAKQLQGNAISQARLEKQAADMQWNSIPKGEFKNYSKTITHTHWTADWTKHDAFHYTTTQRVTWKVEQNQSQVQNAEAKNQQVVAQRQTISSKLSVMQQLAQNGETNINTMSNEAMQSMSEASDILQILESLTFTALLRQAPQ